MKIATSRPRPSVFQQRSCFSSAYTHSPKHPFPKQTLQLAKKKKKKNHWTSSDPFLREDILDSQPYLSCQKSIRGKKYNNNHTPVKPPNRTQASTVNTRSPGYLPLVQYDRTTRSARDHSVPRRYHGYYPACEISENPRGEKYQSN